MLFQKFDYRYAAFFAQFGSQRKPDPNSYSFVVFNILFAQIAFRYHHTPSLYLPDNHCQFLSCPSTSSESKTYGTTLEPVWSVKQIQF